MFLSDPVRLLDLFFVVNVIKHLNDLNIKLQAKNHTIAQDEVKAFQCKLPLFFK